MLDLFSDREIAMGIWICIIIIILFIMAVRFRNIQSSFSRLLKAALNGYIVVFFSIVILYCLIWIILLSKLSFWEMLYIKDITFWVLFIGIPICFNAVTDRSDVFFKNIARSNFRFIILLEFIIGAFTFNLLIEIILVPFATTLVLLNEVAKLDRFDRSVENFFSVLETIFGFTILFFAIKKAINHYVEFYSIDLFVSFSIPILMTFLFLPLSYVFAIYSEYESLFRRIKFRLPKIKKTRRDIKWRLIKECKLSLKRLKLFNNIYLLKLYTRMDEQYFDEIIEDFRISYKK